MDKIKIDIASSWDKWSSEYDNQYAHGIKSIEEEKEWKKVLAKIVGNDRKNILDVGTGTGFLALLFSELGHDCKGLDISEGMLEIAKDKAKTREVDIKFGIGDAEKLPEESNKFDLVVNRHLVWTLPNPEKALREWIRVLKPGGKLVIIDGDWFYENRIYDIKRFMGKLLIAITEFKNPWNRKNDYSKDLAAKLPMMKDENSRNLYNIVKSTGLKDIKIIKLDDLEKIEKKAMPFKQKLLNPYKRMIIIGIKPLE